MKKYRLGIDVGGTFTDLVLLGTDPGEFAVGRVFTTRGDQSAGVLDGMNRLGEAPA